MKRIKLFSILVFLMCTPVLLAQNPLGFFPHKVGDHWEYREGGGSQNIVAILTIEKDSTDANGNIYIKYKQEPDYSIRIDSSLNVFYIKNGAPFTRNSGLYYKLSTEIGDRWVVDDSSTTYLRMWGKVVDIFAGYWLHRPTTIMQIDYWWETQPGDSFWVETRYLPKDLVSLREYLNQVLLIMQQAQLLMA